jgi:hypothetical protein
MAKKFFNKEMQSWFSSEKNSITYKKENGPKKYLLVKHPMDILLAMVIVTISYLTISFVHSY